MKPRQGEVDCDLSAISWLLVKSLTGGNLSEEMANKGLSAALPRGTNLECVTMREDSIRGEVVATDENYGALVIRDETKGVHVINLRYLKALDVEPHLVGCPPIPVQQPVDLQKVQKRLDGTLEDRWSQIQPPKAQLLFNKIKKLFADTRWEGSTIVVLNDTTISPPYDADSINGNPKTIDMIRSRVPFLGHLGSPVKYYELWLFSNPTSNPHLQGN